MPDTRTACALSPEDLRRRLDPQTLPFESTAEVEPLSGTIGQPRALDAIEFGLEVHDPGYNLFVTGQPGSGRTGTLQDYLAEVARARPAPSDWIYVFNFAAPDRPNAIELAAGRGSAFAQDMDEFLAAARREIPRAFESEDYEKRRSAILDDVGARRDALTAELERYAHARGFAVEMTPAGIVTIPIVSGRPITQADFARLPQEVRQQIEQAGEDVQKQVASTLRQLRQLEKEAAERVRGLDREVAQFAIGPLLHELRERYADSEGVIAYLGAVEEDMPGRLGEFRSTGEGELPAFLAALQRTADREADLSRYRVNVLVASGELTGAPVVVERNPTYYNLLGRIDYRVQFGAMVTDFHQIKAGALHRANGGFLLLNALDVLRNPFAWEALKRALLTGEIRIEGLGEQLSALPTATLRPEPVTLATKVVLIGSRELYHLLYALDEDFRELFKVKVDFAPEMDWSDEHVGSYAAFISRRVRDRHLRHFDRSGVARIVEHGARLREHQRKLSTRLIDIADVVTEASFWAGKAGRELVSAEDVDRAVERRRYRSNLAEERLQELIADGTLRVETEGVRVGQINGLSVFDLGDYAFARPSRVSARVSLGRGSVVSIEREIELSGPIHTKGFLILSGYLAAQYAQQWPLSLSATLTFEQAYEGVEGDSASAAELCALLSAIGEIPLRQSVAMTGSVDQHGRIQAVGGVTTKVEGFYAVCSARGLTGDEGVIVPASNVPNLMLRDEIIEAVRAGRFHVWSIESLDEALSILTGLEPGARDASGAFPEGTIHRAVWDRLRAYAERLREFGAENGDGTPR
jgi:lon-related putative ATP-dependent protease